MKWCISLCAMAIMLFICYYYYYYSIIYYYLFPEMVVSDQEHSWWKVKRKTFGSFSCTAYNSCIEYITDTLNPLLFLQFKSNEGKCCLNKITVIWLVVYLTKHRKSILKNASNLNIPTHPEPFPLLLFIGLFCSKSIHI